MGGWTAGEATVPAMLAVENKKPDGLVVQAAAVSSHPTALDAPSREFAPAGDPFQSPTGTFVSRAPGWAGR